MATLLFARQITMWAGPANRFYLHWQRADTLVLILSLSAVALLLYLLVLGIRRTSRGRILLRWLTIVLIADILVGYAGSIKPVSGLVLTAAWMIAAGLGLYAASRPDSRFLERGTTVLAALAWLFPISVVQVLLWKPWNVRQTVPVHAPALRPANQTPVFLFIFDEWSFQRSYADHQLRPLFTNLRELASHALEFTDAHSMAASTNPSVPRLLFQRDGALRPGNGIAFWREGDSAVPSTRLPSIFSAARARGYRTSLIGFYFPYRAVLGDQVETIVNRAYAPKGRRFRERVEWVVFRNLSFLADPLSRRLWELWNSKTICENWVWVN
ncbi:MAG TPA: sulfatase-like hydrolase/transferase, partial [Gemmatimonadales bacterium]